jgi:phospholipid/cholesterol/gamma-HCH transport system permease protein
MRTTGGAAGVGRATTNSVVICYSVILIGNFILTIALNSSYECINDFINRLGIYYGHLLDLFMARWFNA